MIAETPFQAQAGSAVVTAGGPLLLDGCNAVRAEGGRPAPAGRRQGVGHSLHVAAARGAPMRLLGQR
jgi:hypothetical protein